MRELIPFVKEINFDDKISTITSISLEHQEEIKNGEIEGEFIVFGDYKKHADTTEKEIFKYRLPFTTIIPENIKEETIKIDIEDFTYDVIDESIMKVNIDYVITGEIVEKKEEQNEYKEDNRIEEERIPKIIEDYIAENSIEENTEIEKKEEIVEDDIKPMNNNENNDYITYYIHFVTEGETMEDIINKYNTNIENIKIYNDITNINVGDKIIIPER